LGSISITY